MFSSYIVHWIFLRCFLLLKLTKWYFSLIKWLIYFIYFSSRVNHNIAKKKYLIMNIYYSYRCTFYNWIIGMYYHDWLFCFMGAHFVFCFWVVLPWLLVSCFMGAHFVFCFLGCTTIATCLLLHGCTFCLLFFGLYYHGCLSLASWVHILSFNFLVVLP